MEDNRASRHTRQTSFVHERRRKRSFKAISTPHRTLPANAVLRMFECDDHWDGDIGAGWRTQSNLGNCVANELSASYLPTCGRACSSVISGYETHMLKPKNGSLGILLRGRSVQVVGAFPHDADSIGNHGCMPNQKRCPNASKTWNARVYAQARHLSARTSCSKRLDPWSAHRAFIYRSPKLINCVHRTRTSAENYQKAYLRLLEQKPLLKLRGREECAPGPLWNQLMVRWKFTDIIGVVYSADATHAAVHVREAIRRLDHVFDIQRPLLRMYLV